MTAPGPWIERYPSGVDSTLTPRFATIVDAFHATVSRLGDRPLVHHFEHSLTANQVADESDLLAGALLAGGAKRGDRLAICLQNDPDWLVCALAAWKAGLTVVPLNPMLRGPELVRCLVDAGARLLVSSAGYYDTMVASVRDQTPLERIVIADECRCCAGAGTARGSGSQSPRTFEGCEDLAGLLLAASHGDVPTGSGIDPDGVALLTYTSGTTGPPKGAMNTHRNLVYNAEMSVRWFALSDDDVILAIAPLFHITGLVVQLGASIVSGAPMALFHQFEPAEALRMMRRWSTTYSIGAITAYIAMLSSPELSAGDFRTMTKVSSGGAPVSAAVVDRFHAATGCYIHNCYGLTETTAPVTLTPIGARPPLDATSGALSVGLPVPGAVIDVVDVATRSPVAPGDVGEIVVAGPMVVAGYWNNPGETEHAMPAGRLHTGDVGFMDAEGWVYLVDRAKDQINASGYKIWPREVEDVLYRHSAVKEAAVVGAPDEYRGETVHAFVVLRDWTAATAEELIAFCRRELSAYKVPRRVSFVPELPKTPSGKIMRRALHAATGPPITRSS